MIWVCALRMGLPAKLGVIYVLEKVLRESVN